MQRRSNSFLHFSCSFGMRSSLNRSFSLSPEPFPLLREDPRQENLYEENTPEEVVDKALAYKPIIL